MGRSLTDISAPGPVGELIPLVGAASSNPAIGGAEYLETGVLKPIAGYESLLTAAPGLTCTIGTAQTSTNQVTGHIVGGNGYFYGLTATGSFLNYVTSLSGTWDSVSGSENGVTNSDLFMFGNRCIRVSGLTSNSVLTNVNTDVSTTASMVCGAANSAGTLGVMAASTNGVDGNIYTSVNGSAWTSRTPIGGSPVARLAMWCQPAGVFIYLGANGSVYSSTDGFTLTNRGAAVVGATAAAIEGDVAAKFWSASATSTMFIANFTVGGVTSAYIVRTTDGVNFSSSRVADAIGMRIVSGPRLAYVEGRYIVYSFSTATASGQPLVFSTSADDGATFVRGAVPISQTGPSTARIVGEANGAKFYLAGENGLINTVSTFNSATHVGWLWSLATAASPNNVPYYVRIK